jgi:hypothetical protein
MLLFLKVKRSCCCSIFIECVLKDLIFYRVDEQASKDDTVKVEANANTDKRENEIRSIKSSSPTIVSSNIDPHDEDKRAEPDAEPIKKSPHLTGAQLILQQFYAILVKRAKHTMRTWKMYLTLV